MYLEREEILQGTVDSVIFQNRENGYTVLRLRCEDGETATVVGVIPMTVAGERLMVTGRWGSHPSHGRQFEAEFLERLMPETEAEILRYLSSRAVRGIGEKTAERIVTRFGKNALDVMEQTPERLAEITGISPKKAAEIGEAFRSQVGIRRLMEFLMAHGLPAELAMRIYRQYGTEAETVIRENPYLLTEPALGADFAVVDEFALELGLEGDDDRRVEAGTLFELAHNLNNGHTFLPRDKLRTATAQMLDLPPEIIDAAMIRLGGCGRMALDSIAGLEACYLPELYEAETYTAARLAHMAAAQESEPGDLPALLEQVQRSQSLRFAAAQVDAISQAACRRVLIVTGGPGTGKTTTLGGILRLFDLMQLKTQLAAPTGRAAKRLSELAGREAATIHRLLEVQFSEQTGDMVFSKDEDEPLKADAMIVDEVSMVDLPLMQALLRALPEDCRLILVGDPDQLPSVGPGNVFSDLLRSGKIPTVRLTEIFRQARESLIVMNAHAVNRGELPVLNAKDRDFFFLRRLDPAKTVETIRELCSRRLPENMGIPPEDIQVLSPTRKHETGTANLNRVLQGVLNPPVIGKKEKTYGNYSFREGDRVMQIRNNYDIIWKRTDGIGVGTGIFNGDVGKITALDFSQETATIIFDDREAVYEFDMLSELEPAYAMTVHKSQGSEYRAVILAVSQGSPYLLTRSVLYTAITRARELLILVGDERVLAYMTENNRQSRRYSGLKLRLERGE
ncbi:MAG: ATP-dependent RecD-like DNA helicase [Oscillospiraceae bacterium]|nr:ATP-dependent RecD-like DNA helicase [Oscillospiraceae bacterium]